MPSVSPAASLSFKDAVGNIKVLLGLNLDLKCCAFVKRNINKRKKIVHTGVLYCQQHMYLVTFVEPTHQCLQQPRSVRHKAHIDVTRH